MRSVKSATSVIFALVPTMLLAYSLMRQKRMMEDAFVSKCFNSTVKSYMIIDLRRGPMQFANILVKRPNIL